MQCLRSRIVLASALISLGLAGCGTTTRALRFYVFSSLAPPMRDAGDVAVETSTVIGLAKVDVPAYLEHPQIAVRQSATRLHLAEFERWAEPFGSGVTRVMASNLRALLPDRQIVILPYSGKEDLRIIVGIQRLDGVLGKSVVLDATWMIRRPGSNDPLAAGSVHETQSLSSEDYSAYVAAQSTLMIAVCRELSEAIRRAAP